ncbi:hypothetical protein PF005_g16344 [Phytophthora fragariae]|uniref:Uncharacterized protein n=1 Tax=Phytophthora fragariae TaxID=53985 RepID=A0A6A3JRC2_9STRA|nr:hypothetical protein PF003_g25067 [Phytophthora fragariae]KAE8932826.1 hypothetical protein PF009_g17150 [Phytophthora fragariae]KAE8997670.1 hypothetical protein PF011_g15380 [Phytophthora fragariae]KAE9095677.1 hypothetical protein PF010_g16617 [Phytophthora fragariae]KAE9095794.1 hypothetical protein PF007_g17248 [Phytophthora fragariae]
MVRVVGARWLLLGSSPAAGVGRFVAIARFGDCAACVAASVSARSSDAGFLADPLGFGAETWCLYAKGQFLRF